MSWHAICSPSVFIYLDRSFAYYSISVELKSSLSRLIKEYHIKSTLEDPYKLNIHERFLIMPEKVSVRLEKRPSCQSISASHLKTME